MDKLSFMVNEFEGPLDLILHLISKHQMNIQDIEISSLLEQYMAAISKMEADRMEVSSEFLEMASRLVYIKTVSLLPRQEDEPDPKAELVGQLIEYQACREAAYWLRQNSLGFDSFVREPAEVEIDETYTRRHMASELINHYLDAMGRGKRRMPPPEESFSPLVRTVIVPVSSRITYILRRLHGKKTLKLQEVFEASENRSELVATFLAVLVLVRDSRINLLSDGEEIAFSTIGASLDPDLKYELSDNIGIE